MTKTTEKSITEDEKEEINKIASMLFALPREDRALMLSNANILKVRNDLEKARKEAVQEV